MLKELLQNILPTVVFDFLKRKKLQFSLLWHLMQAYRYDMNRYIRFSDTFGSNTAQKLIGKIIKEYHVVEKGLTMPDTKLGFGRELLFNLATNCRQYIEKYGETDEQLEHAVGVVLEYEQFHQNCMFQLEAVVANSIHDLKQVVAKTTVCRQKDASIEDYFRYSESPFFQFAKSRSSIRNYSTENIPTEKLIEVLDLARTAPSACNRQCWRTYVFENKDQINSILIIQGGNRGFGHLVNKLIVITAEVGVFANVGERNESFIDGGIYAMNVLYALHYYKIGACMLNCSNTIEKDLTLRKLCDIRESEVFIAMISCGIPPENFRIALSKRYDLGKTNTLR
ncbi:MAG: nitroreductase family protein [Bacteroidota bacterium]|nr:nitroreductase family protein [Bacteroidota bacterium]